MMCTCQSWTSAKGSGRYQCGRKIRLRQPSSPQTVTSNSKREVRSFLGLVGYYRDFIPHFSSIATPLTDLTRKDRSNQVEWKPEHQQAFDQLREAMNREPILKMPDFSKTFILQTDASENGAGAGFMQEHQGVNHHVAFCSRKFLPREKRYSVIERECLALVWAVQKFQKYLYGVEFIL